MCERTYRQMQRSAVQRSAAHQMLRLEATCIYSAAYVWTHHYIKIRHHNIKQDGMLAVSVKRALKSFIEIQNQIT